MRERVSVLLGLFLVSACLTGVAMAGEQGVEYVWSTGLSVGILEFEGDEEVEDSTLYALNLGLDLSERWSFEGTLYLVPELKENFANSYGEKVSRLELATGRDIDDTSAWGAAIDAVYHFTRWERLDPYVAVGAGVMRYADDFGSQADPSLRVGGGVMYHFTDQVSARADARALMAGDNTEANAIVTAGLVWTFGASVPVTADGPSAQDLKDEGVTDETDPTVMDDDLMFFELGIQFDEGNWSIRPEYLSDLDAIAAILREKADATALIEGHDDAAAGRSGWSSRRVTRKRAGAVKDYMTDKWQIDASRLKAVGLGTDRPKDPADLQSGSSDNQRIEIYLRGAK